MSAKGYIAIGLGIIGVIMIAVVAIFMMPATTPPATVGFEKGAQLTQAPAPVTPLPTGPTEPTPLPTSAGATAPGQPAATVLPMTTPAPTSLAAPATLLPGYFQSHPPPAPSLPASFAGLCLFLNIYQFGAQRNRSPV